MNQIRNDYLSILDDPVYSNNTCLFSDLPEELKKDKVFYQKLFHALNNFDPFMDVDVIPAWLSQMDKSLYKDKEFVLSFFNGQHPRLNSFGPNSDDNIWFVNLPEHYWEDRDFIFSLAKAGHLSNQGLCLKIPPEWADSEELLREAIVNQSDIRMFFPELLEDISMCQLLGKYNIGSLEYLPQSFRNNPFFMLHVLHGYNESDEQNQTFFMPNLLGKKLCKEIGKNDPYQYLISLARYQEFEKSLTLKAKEEQHGKVKI